MAMELSTVAALVAPTIARGADALVSEFQGKKEARVEFKNESTWTLELDDQKVIRGKTS
jgi:hypothetical protein